MEKRNYIQSIFDKFLSRHSSPQEMDELFTYFDKADERELKSLIEKEWDIFADDYEISTEERKTIARLDLFIIKHINESSPYANRPDKLTKKRLPFSRWAAAAIFLVAGFSIFYWQPAGVKSNGKLRSVSIKYDSEPGRPRAKLTLEDGTDIQLNEDKEGITVSANQVKYSNGNPITTISSTQFNIISTPRGGKYRITLSDGTKVWLNSASSLRYPNAFLEGERKVELNGEGYFEVAKDANRPFKVSSKTQTVTVLGTHFSINAYPDEAEVKTTLVEGSVKVYSVEGKRSVRLSPGYQASLSGDDIEVRSADLEAVLAWKQDDFIFRGQDLKTTMRQLARWYDVEVLYAPTAPMHLKIGGSVSKNNKLSSVLRAMQSTNSVRFEFDGKTILVK